MELKSDEIEFYVGARIAEYSFCCAKKNDKRNLLKYALGFLERLDIYEMNVPQENRSTLHNFEESRGLAGKVLATNSKPVTS